MRFIRSIMVAGILLGTSLTIGFPAVLVGRVAGGDAEDSVISEIPSHGNTAARQWIP